MSIISKLFICAQILDGATTFIALSMFTGLFRETNPIVPYAGWPAMAAYKIFITIVFVWVTEKTEYYTPIKLVTVFTALVVLSNAAQILWVVFR